MVLIGLGFKGFGCSRTGVDAGCCEGRKRHGGVSTTPKAAAFAVLLRILYVAFPALHSHWQPLVWWMAALSMTFGNLGALRQQNVKRMLAYSSIACRVHSGCVHRPLSPD